MKKNLEIDDYEEENYELPLDDEDDNYDQEEEDEDQNEDANDNKVYNPNPTYDINTMDGQG